MNCWKILKIEPTTDIKAIKHAYAILAKTCHPEENPEGFKSLQEAYQEAISYAKDARRQSNGQATFSSEGYGQAAPPVGNSSTVPPIGSNYQAAESTENYGQTAPLENNREQPKTTSTMPVYRPPQQQAQQQPPQQQSQQRPFQQQSTQQPQPLSPPQSSQQPLTQQPLPVSGVVTSSSEETNQDSDKEAIPGREYYSNLFKDREQEIDNRIVEQGKVYKYKFEYLLRSEQSNNILAWRDILKREDFKYAVYDLTFLKEVLYLLQYGTPCADVLFEIYYYFMKNKAQQDWYDVDYQILTVIKNKLI